MSCHFQGIDSAAVSAFPFFDFTVDIGRQVAFVAWIRWDLTPIWTVLTGGPGAIC